MTVFFSAFTVPVKCFKGERDNGNQVEKVVMNDEGLRSAEELGRKRAYCYEEPDELVEAVRKYLNKETLDQSPDPDNSEFLERYGIYKTDGKVAMQAIDALDAIVSGANQ